MDWTAHAPANNSTLSLCDGKTPAVLGRSCTCVPCVHLLVPQSEHLLHGGYPGAGEAFLVLTHLDGFQPLGYGPEHGAVTAAGAG